MSAFIEQKFFPVVDEIERLCPKQTSERSAEHKVNALRPNLCYQELFWSNSCLAQSQELPVPGGT